MKKTYEAPAVVERVELEAQMQRRRRSGENDLPLLDILN